MKISVVMVDGSFRENLYGADSFCIQTFDKKDYEVIWVEFYKSASKELPDYPNLKVVTLGNPETTEYHSSCCFNKGIELASGEIVVVPDADQLVKPDFLSKVWRNHEAYDRLVTYYYRYDEPHKGALKSLTFKELDEKCVLKNPTNYGGCLSVRKKWLIEINGYEMHPLFKSGFHANGLDVYTRFKNLGLSINWATDAKLYHPWHLSTLTAAPQLESQRRLINWRAKNLQYMALRGINSNRDIERKLPEVARQLVEEELLKTVGQGIEQRDPLSDQKAQAIGVLPKL